MSTAEDKPQARQNANLVRSFLLGPMRSIVPALLNIALIPIIVSKGGLHAVGYWGTINLIVSIFLLCDLGVSQHISRALSARSHDSPAVRCMIEVVFSFWFVLSIGVVAVFLVFSGPVLTALDIPLEPQSVAGLVLVSISGLCALYCGVFVFLHISIHQVPFAQVNQAAGALVQFVCAALLLQILHPYLALAGAIALAYAVRTVGLYSNLRRVGFDALPRRMAFPSISLLRDIFLQSKGFALLGASQQMFQVANRSAILAFGGTSVLGAFEIANRVPFLLEQAFGNGLQPLFAVFAAANWQGEEGRKKLQRLAQWVFRLLVVTSSACLAAWVALSGPVIGIWLDLARPKLILATQLFAIYNAIRSFNAPTFWFLQARGGETALGAIYMAQALLLLPVLSVAAMFGEVDLLTGAIAITVLSVIAELSALAVAEIRYGYVRTVISGRNAIQPLVISAVLMVSAWLIAAPPTRRANAIQIGLTPAAIFFGLWVVALLVASGGRPDKLLKPDLSP
jgi:O-antigen/teichoic acid export membrane protein